MNQKEFQSYNAVTTAIAERLKEVFPQLKNKASLGRLNALIQEALENNALLPQVKEALIKSIKQKESYAAYEEAKKEVQREHEAAHALHLEALKIKNEYHDKLAKLEAQVKEDQKLAEAIRVLMRTWQKANPNGMMGFISNMPYPYSCFGR